MRDVTTIRIILLFLGHFVLFFVLPTLGLSSGDGAKAGPTEPPLSRISLSFGAELLHTLRSHGLRRFGFVLHFHLLPKALHPPLPRHSSFPI